MEKPHRGEDLEAKGPQLAKNLRLRHSEIFWGCGNWLVVEDLVFLVCVFVVLLGILCIFLFFLLSLYTDSWPCHVLLVVVAVVFSPLLFSSSLLLVVVVIVGVVHDWVEWYCLDAMGETHMIIWLCGIHLLIIRCWSGLLEIGIDKWRYVEQVVFYIRIWHPYLLWP